MATKYEYNGEEYKSLSSLRQAIWTVERVAFGTPEDQAAWDALGLEHLVIMKEYDPEDEVTDEMRARRVRRVRDSLISETDYLLAADYPISESDLAAVKAYRQALRDVPQQSGFPKTVEWPEKPSILGGD